MLDRSRMPVWIFDLDNTLHNTSVHIFPHIDQAMTAYIAAQLRIETADADVLRQRYWQRYGATMIGMARLHNTDPAHFLHHTHQFDDLHSMVVFERALRAMLKRLPGRKVVCSNGPFAYVSAVLAHMRVRSSFDQVFGIEQLLLHPKPERRAFRTVLGRLRVPAERCVLVEDSLENLRSAKSLGMRTVWITQQRSRPQYVDIKLRSVLQLRRAVHRWVR